MTSIILEPSRLVQNLPRHENIKTNFLILQTKQIVKFMLKLQGIH